MVVSLGRMPVEVTHFTDPACPFAFSAEPVRQRLRWHYGDQLGWSTRMIVLTREPGEAEKLAAGAPNLQRRYGMPIDPAPYPRPASSEPACRAVVAARLHAPAAAEPLLRRLRVRTMAGGLLDDPALIAAARRMPGSTRRELDEWSRPTTVAAALQADIARGARSPPARRARSTTSSAAAQQRRYMAPSYELAPPTAATASRPRVQPGRGLRDGDRQPRARARAPAEAGSVDEVLAWAGEPLATAEVAAVALLDPTQARAALSRVARPTRRRRRLLLGAAESAATAPRSPLRGSPAPRAPQRSCMQLHMIRLLVAMAG